jgi:D-3-phosphoglycerate dehydrogenase
VLVIYNDDKPGVIGAVGTVCGRHNINICTMGVGQKAAEHKAMLAVSLDKEPDAEGMKELGGLDFVNEIYLCRLG